MVGRVIFQVRRRRLQTAAVARQLPGRERQELFGRQALGIPGREEAVAVDDRPAAQLRGQILDRAVIIAQFAKQRAGGQERIEQQAEFLRLFLLRPLQIPVVAERDDRLLRQICGGRGELRIDERHIAVGAGKERFVLKCFAVLLQGVDQRLIGRFPALLARDDRAQVLAQPRRALWVQMRLRLRHGQEDGLFHVFRAPLGDGVKIAHGVELVAEKLRAQRVFARGRIHVQNAAAQGELPHALDEARAGIARPRQPGDQIVHVVFRPAPQPHGGREQDLPRHRAQQQRVQARHQNRHLPLRQRVQQPQPLLLPLPRDADGPRERQLARRQHRRLLTQKRAELRRKPGSRQIILTHRDERAARMLVQRREHMAPRRLAQARDGSGLLRLHGLKQLHIIRALLQKRKQNVHGLLLKNKLRQHRTIASARFDGSFPPILRFEKLGLAKNLSPDLLAELCGAASEISDKQATRIGEFLLCVLAFLILCGKPLKTACRYIPRPPFHSRFSRCTAPPPPRAPSRPDSRATRSSTRWRAPSRPGRSPGAAWRRRRS